MAAPRRTARHASRAAAARPWSLKPVCLAVLGMAAWLGMPTAWALPDGGLLTQGQAQLQASGNGTLTIHQTSAQAGFDWRSFSIAAGERVQVLQPDARSILFNRVTGADPSLILGQLQANGRVFLSNPRGIVFGAGSQVDVGGLLATTLTVNRTAGADGRWQLGGGDAATGALRMDGSIRAPGGTVALVGPQLSVGGNVLAGRLGLAAAGAVQVDVDGDGLIFFNLRDENLAARLQLLPGAHLLARSAELRAAARSQFADTVLNLDGVVRAQGLVQQGDQVVIGGPAPQILVDGGPSGVTRVAGTLDASATGAGETGGQVQVLGERVWLASSARLDARGDAGGGLLQVGGAWQGRGPERNALHTRVSAGAQLDASAIRLGDGGQVVVWADDSTVFDGAIRARGGLLGGHGGAVETSGKLRLGIGSGVVDAGAQPGWRAGLWLLDPTNITVSATGTSPTDGSVAFNDDPGATLNISPTALQDANVSVLLQATGNITIRDSVTLTGTEAFTAQAGANVDVEGTATITTAGGDISLQANQNFNNQVPSFASGTGRVSMLGRLVSGSGAITIGLAGGTGQHVLGGSFSGPSLSVTGNAALHPTVAFNVNTLTLPATLTLTANTRITVDGGRAPTIASAIGDGAPGGTGFSLTKEGTGTLTLSGTNTYRGGTVVAGGRLQVNADGRLGAANGALTLQGGGRLVWDVGDASPTINRPVLVSGAGTLDVAGAGTLELAGNLSGSGTLVKSGAGGLALAGSNGGFTGAVQLDGGLLSLRSAVSLGAGNAVTLSSTATTTLDVRASNTLGALSGGVVGGPPTGVAIASGQTLSVDGNGSALAAVVSGDGTLAKLGAGTLVLTGANVHTGGTKVAGGTLQVNADNQLGASTGSLTFQDGATLVWDATGGAQSTARTVVLGTDGGTLAVTGSLGLTGALSGAGALTKAGSGTLTLANPAGTGNQAFTGSVALAGGTLALSGALQLGSANAVSLSTSDPTTLNVQASTTLGALSGGVAGGPSDGVDIASGQTLSADGNGNALAAVVRGAGTLAKVGPGTLVLSAANVHTGGTLVAGGTLQVNADNQLGASTGSLSLQTGGTLAWDAGNAAQTVIRPVALPSGDGRFDVAGGVALTLAGNLGGSGTLVKLGDGALALSGSNGSFSGAVRIDAGQLSLASATALGAGNAVTLSSTAASTLAVDADVRIGALSGGAAGGAPLGSVLLELNSILRADGDGSALAAAISGDGALAKAGGGTLLLTGTNQHGGGTAVQGGSLLLGNALSLPAGTALQVSAGVLDLGNLDTSVATLQLTGGELRNGTLQARRFDLQAGSASANLRGGADGLAKTGTGEVTLSGTNTYTGATTVSNGRLVLAGAGALPGSAALTVDGSGSVDLGGVTRAAGVFTLEDSGSVGNGGLSASLFQLRAGSLDASLAGTAQLVKDGTGTVSLGRASPLFTGPAIVRGGTLALEAAGALSASSGVSLDGPAGTLLAVDASNSLLALSVNSSSSVAIATGRTLTHGSLGGAAVSQVSGSITGGGGLATLGGSLTLTGNNSFSGGTTVTGGTLVLDGGNALADGGTVQVAAGANLQLADNETVGALTGAGNVALGGRTLTVTPPGDSSFSGRIDGTGGLVKRGAGTLTLSGSNLFTGTTRVAVGTLALAGGAALADAAPLQVDSGATLRLDGSETVGALSGAGRVALGASTLTMGTADNPEFSGQIGGSGGLVKQGLGSLTLSGNNDFSGRTEVRAGALVLAGGAALRNTAALQIDGGASVRLAASQTLGPLSGNGSVDLSTHTLTLAPGPGESSVFNGNLDGAGSLVKRGDGSLTLAGSNSPGSTRVAQGRLVLAQDSALPGNAAVQVDGGATLQLQTNKTLGALTGTGAVALGPHLLTLDSAADTAFGGALSGTGGLVKRGNSLLTLSGSNAFSGGTTVQAGSLRLAGGAALADGGALQLDAGSTLRLDADEGVGTLSGSGAVVLGAHTLTVNASADAGFGGNIGGSGGLVKQGAGTLTLLGSNTQQGGTTLRAGALVADSDARLGAVGAPLTFDGGTLRVGIGQALQLPASRPVVVAAGGGTLDAGAAGSVGVAGPVSGSGALAKRGAGDLLLQGDNRGFSGAIDLQVGRLLVSGGQALPDAGSVALAGGTSLVVDSSEVLGQLSGSGGVSLATGTLLRLGTAANASFDGSFSGNGGLVKQGSGRLTLTAASSQLGGTQVLGGVLQVASDASLGNTTAPLTLDGGSLRLASATLLQLAASRPLVLGAGGGTVDVLDSAGLVDLPGGISGSGSLRKLGAGSLRLGGGSSGFSGTVDLAAGSLRLAGGQALPDATALALAAGSLLQIDTSERLGTLAGSGSVLLGAGSLLSLGTAADASFAGSFSGGGGLVKLSSGALTLAGTSSHSGGTRMQQGRLVVSADRQLGAVAGGLTLDGGSLATTGSSPVLLDAGRSVQVGNGGATLDVAASAALQIAGPLAGSGALGKQGDGALTLSGDNIGFNGAVVVQAGSLALQHARALGGNNAVQLGAGTQLAVQQSVTIGSLAGAGDATLAAGATLSTGLASSRFDGDLLGDGALRKLGTGVLTLAGSNSHRVGTTLQAGTLRLLGGQALPDAAPLALAGGTLQVDASERIGALSGNGAVALANGRVLTVGDAASTRFDGSFGGGGALVKQGSGTLSLGGASSHGGGTRVAAGVLAITADAALGDAAGTLTLDGGSLRASGGTPLALAPQRTVAVGAAGGTLDVDAGTTLQLAGPLAGAGSLAKAGAGSLALAGANTGFSGAVQVGAGRLALQQAQALGAANAVDLAAGSTLDLGAALRLGPLSGSGAVQFNGFTLATGGADSVFSGTLAGSGVLQHLGGGRLTLDAATGFSGSTQVLGGTLALAHADALTGSPVSVAPGATLAVQASSRIQALTQPGATGGQVLLADGATLSTGAAADTSFAGSISGAGALRKLGSGRFTLAGSNSYGGGTRVDAGTLQGDSTSLQGDFTVAGQLVFDQAGDGGFNGGVSGSGSLVKQGSGALLLTGQHQHSGGTQVLAGRLQLAGGQAVPDGGAVSLAAGSTLQVDASETLARLSGTGRLQLQPGTVLTLGDASSFGFDGTLAGSGALVKQGSGQLVLGGAGGHSGSTTVLAGSLALAAADVLADSSVTLASQPGVELRLLGDARIGALASSDGPAAPAVVLGAFSLAAGGNGDSTRFAGSTQGSGSLVKQGTGTLTLAGSNHHTGATQVQGGSLALLGAQALASASPVQVDAGASLVLQAAQTIGALAGNGTVQLGGFQLATVVSGDSLFSGQISGSGGLAKLGAGRLTLAGANSFSGAVDLQQGTLALAGGAALADGTAVQLAAGSLLRAADNETLGTLAGAGDVLLDTGTLTTVVDGSHTLTGQISGAGRLAKAGAGSLTLAGANSHTGGLALLGGSLVVASDSALGALPSAAQPADLLFDGGTLHASGSFTLAAARSLVLQGAGGTLQVDAGHTLGLPATLADGSSAGMLAKTGAGRLALTATADSSRSGATVVQAGQLALQRDGQLGIPAGALVLDGGTLQIDQTLRLADARPLQLGAGGGTLQVADGATLQLGGLVADSAGAGGGVLSKTGAGSLALDGAVDNSFTGATRLLGGNLVIQRDGQLGTAPAVATPGQLLIDGGTLQITGDTVLAAHRGLALGAAGATLQVDAGRVAGLAAAVADAPGASGGNLVKTGAGLLRLQGTAASSHTGATQVLGGTLALAADAQLGAAPAAPTPGHLLLDGGTLLAETGFTLAAQRGLLLGPAGGTLAVADGQQLAYAGVLASSSASAAEGTLTKTGGGRLLLDGAAPNTHAGATQVRAGTLAVARDDQLGAAPTAATPGHLLLDGGTLQIGASTTLAAQRGLALGALGGVLDVAPGARVVYDGVLADAAAGTPGGIDKAGAGSLVLGGASTHTGTTRVLAGSLATSADQRLPQAGAVQLANGASLVLGGDQTLAALGDAPNPGGAPADASALVDLGAFTLRLDTGADDGRSFYSGAFTGSGGQLLKQGGGTLQLAGSGVGRNLVTVDAGLLVSLGGNSLSTEAVVTVAPGAALRLMAPVTVQSLDLAGRLSGPGGLTASTQVDLRDAVVDTTVATTALHSQGNSQLNAAVLAGTSLLTGGVLTLGDAGSLQTGTLALQGGASLATQVAGQLRGLPAVDVDRGRLQLAGAEQVASLRLAGTLAGPGSLGVAGATLLQGASVGAGLDTDTLRSTGTNTIDAAVVARRSATLAGGSLALGAAGSLATPLLTLEAGTLATGTGTGLATDSRLVVQRPATLLLGADQRLASLDLAGTLGAAPVAPAAGAAGAAGAGAALGQQRALADASPTAATPQLAVDGAVVLDGASIFNPLTASTLTSSGSTTLAAPVRASAGTTVTGGLLSVAASGQLSTPSLQVQAGGVATGAAQGLQADTQLALAAGTTLQLGGDQVLARLADLGAAGAAPAQVQLGSFSLAAGADGADAVFSGQFSGAGTLAKQGAGTWLLRSDQAHGDTRIEAGTLQLGDGGSSGSLGGGAVLNQGLLRFDRADTVRITQAISGSGGLQQAGSGSLVIAGSGLSYTGDTTVSAGSLRTEGADRLPDATHLRLAAGTRLATGGDDRLGAISADGAVSLGGSLASTGHQVYNGPVAITATAPVTLSAPLARIEALHPGNQWGAQPLSIDAGQLLLGAGRAGAATDAAWRDLSLGQVTLRGLADGGAPAASQIDANQLQIGAAVAPGAAATGDARLDGQLTLLAGSSLALRAHAAPAYQVPVPGPGEVAAVDPLRGREIALASDALWQNPHSQVRTEAGAGLQLQASAGASIRLDQTGNRFDGAVSALSGASFNTAWTAVVLPGGRPEVGQSVIRLAGQVVQVGGGGVEADVLRLAVGRLGTEASSPLAARLWYNDAAFGQQQSTPGLQITLLPEALTTPFSLGSADRAVQVRVGSVATGGRTEGLNAGYVQLLPKRAAGGVAVFLAGPKVGEAAYSFFQDGAGDLAEVPLFYNNVLPATPQLAGSLSAVASVSETARRERFDETVRTENVAIRLRAGVIAEVGPGRPATQGTQGLRLPSSCSPVGNLLGCGGVP